MVLCLLAYCGGTSLSRPTICVSKNDIWDETSSSLRLFAVTSTLQTARLILRPFRSEDLDLFADFFADGGFMRFSSGPFSRERTAEFINKVIRWDRDGLPSQFVVTLRENLAPIGYCGFFHQVVDAEPEIEIGYRLHPDFWNKGFATEAARAVRDCGFSEWKLDRVISLIHPENTASRRVAEKNGMILEKETVFKGFPTQVFAMNRQQWLAVHAG
jgi:ribosomal-protein-alanine N-acetyltransferase